MELRLSYKREISKGYGTARAGVDQNILPDFTAEAPVPDIKNVQNITFTKQDIILHPCKILDFHNDYAGLMILPSAICSTFFKLVIFHFPFSLFLNLFCLFSLFRVQF